MDLQYAEATCTKLKWQIEYIRTLLASPQGEEEKAVQPTVNGKPLHRQRLLGPYQGMSAPEVVRQILLEAGGPLRVTEIGHKAVEGGYAPEKTVREVVPLLSSMISKDFKRG